MRTSRKRFTFVMTAAHLSTETPPRKPLLLETFALTPGAVCEPFLELSASKKQKSVCKASGRCTQSTAAKNHPLGTLANHLDHFAAEMEVSY